MKKFFYKNVFLFFPIIFGCTSSQIQQQDENLIIAEFFFQIDSIRMWSADSIKNYIKYYGIFHETAPLLRIWSASITDRPNQEIAQPEKINPVPDETFTEEENGNKIYYWDLSKLISANNSITIKRTFAFRTYEYRPVVKYLAATDIFGNDQQELKNFYTKSEPFLEQTQEIKDTAQKITEGKKGILMKAKVIFDYVRSKMKYKYPPEKRGVIEAFRTSEGDCGQYSALFITLCRAVGIPARQQSGFAIENGKFGYHVWSEIYQPQNGWIPIDATKEDGFGKIPEGYLISSVGMNIPLSMCLNGLVMKIKTRQTAEQILCSL